MKNLFIRHFTMWFLLSVYICFSCGGCKCMPDLAVVPIPVQEKDCFGKWIGFDCNDGLSFLLVLKGGHSGSFLSEMPYGKPVEYQVVRWDLRGGTIICSFGNKIQPGGPSVLKCDIASNHISGQFEGPDGWRQKVFFRKLEDLNKSLSNLGINNSLKEIN